LSSIVSISVSVLPEGCVNRTPYIHQSADGSCSQSP
jgi:hypothetical protein